MLRRMDEINLIACAVMSIDIRSFEFSVSFVAGFPATFRLPNAFYANLPNSPKVPFFHFN